MPLILARRAEGAREWMDRPDCDRRKLENTYRQFEGVNRLFSAWRLVYRRYLQPLMRPGTAYSLLDIGCGGGDIPLRLGDWAAADGLSLAITAIDPDPRAAAFLERRRAPPNVRFCAEDAGALASRGERFDFVVSNNLLHHLDAGQFLEVCAHSQRLCRRRAVHNDIRRGDLAYAVFGLLTAPVFRDSFITPDGLTSIRRSYTPAELRRAAPAGWRVEGVFPYRNLLIYDAKR